MRYLINLIKCKLKSCTFTWILKAASTARSHILGFDGRTGDWITAGKQIRAGWSCRQRSRLRCNWCHWHCNGHNRHERNNSRCIHARSSANGAGQVHLLTHQFLLFTCCLQLFKVIAHIRHGLCDGSCVGQHIIWCLYVQVLNCKCRNSY